MRTLPYILFLAAAIMTASAAAGEASVKGAPVLVVKHEDLSDLGIKFTELPVSSAGTVESVAGGVIRATESGWVAVRVGEVLADGARVQLLQGATLGLRFSNGDVARLSPVPPAQSLAIVVKRRP